MSSKPTTIEEYHDTLLPSDRVISDALKSIIDRLLAGSTSKLWHGHPVWFINDNPIVGYDKLKSCVRLLFWSGQSFDESGLQAEGNFKAAEARYTDPSQMNPADLERWLHKAQTIQWNYKNIVKRRGVLERLV